MMYFQVNVKLVYTSLNKDPILNKNLYLLNGYTAKKLLKEFSCKHLISEVF